MKKLQNNFTTPEQSKRLLELGVPANSADCYMLNNQMTHGWDMNDYELYVDDYSRYDPFYYGDDSILPCWSVGRLMEIYKIVGEEAGQCISCSTNQSQVESLVQLYEENIELLDFSKLDE